LIGSIFYEAGHLDATELTPDSLTRLWGHLDATELTPDSLTRLCENILTPKISY